MKGITDMLIGVICLTLSAAVTQWIYTAWIA